MAFSTSTGSSLVEKLRITGNTLLRKCLSNLSGEQMCTSQTASRAEACVPDCVLPPDIYCLARFREDECPFAQEENRISEPIACGCNAVRPYPRAFTFSYSMCGRPHPSCSASNIHTCIHITAQENGMSIDKLRGSFHSVQCC